jgi:hypothetical protein
MITERYGRHTVTMWETIDELPIDRFTAWNKYMMIDGALGSTFEEIDQLHLSQFVSVLDDKAKAMQQVVNMRELVFNIINGINYKHHAYCCLVYAIDGVEAADYSDSGIKETLARLAKIGVSNGAVKKKILRAKKFCTEAWKRFSRISSTARRNTTIGKR